VPNSTTASVTRVIIGTASAAAALCLLTDGRATSAEVPRTTEVLREAVVCGPNAALMYLTLCGVDVDGKAVNQINCSPAGASLLELQDFCASAGVSSEVRKYSPSEYDAMPLPAIVQARSRGGGHHFYVVYHVDRDWMSTLDGTTGRQMHIPAERVGGFLTGYALVPSSSVFGRVLSAGAVFNWCLFATNVALTVLICLACLNPFQGKTALLLRRVPLRCFWLR
jgi:ABC-type bacteriocin/lantibiotic exporter with double-glycine peptidase domain